MYVLGITFLLFKSGSTRLSFSKTAKMNITIALDN